MSVSDSKVYYNTATDGNCSNTAACFCGGTLLPSKPPYLSTASERRPWYKVDLGKTTQIGEVRLLNQGGLTSDAYKQMNNFQVTVGSDPNPYSNHPCAEPQATAIKGWNHIDCAGLEGNVVGQSGLRSIRSIKFGCDTFGFLDRFDFSPERCVDDRRRRSLLF